MPASGRPTLLARPNGSTIVQIHAMIVHYYIFYNSVILADRDYQNIYMLQGMPYTAVLEKVIELSNS